MTEKRYEELTRIYRWHSTQSRMIYRTESAGEPYKYNPEARRVLLEWLAEKERAAGVTEAERDEYDAITEGMSEMHVSRWEDQQR